MGVGGGSGNLEGGVCGPSGAEAHRWSTGLGGDTGTEVLLVGADCVVSGAGGQGGEIPSVKGVVTWCVDASGAGAGVMYGAK